MIQKHQVQQLLHKWLESVFLPAHECHRRECSLPLRMQEYWQGGFVEKVRGVQRLLQKHIFPGF